MSNGSEHIQDNTDPLLAAVEALTKPSRRKQLQDILQPYTVEDEEGVETEHQRVVGSQKVTVETPPLLELLDDAIKSSMGGTTKGAALASESIPLNSAALFEAIKIASTVRDWCRQADVTPRDGIAANLAAWNSSVYARDLTEDQAAFYTTTCRKWANSIRAMLDPWREKDLPDPCPVCGATEWWDPADRAKGGTGRGRPRPLMVRYRPGPEMIERAYAMCRACEEVFGVRELRYAIEQAALVDEPTG
jgi:hypothetical protein